YDYGNTTVGDGKLSSFIFISRDNFTMDAYTQIYITAIGTKNIDTYSKKYDDIASQLNNELVKLKPERENARYEEIYNKAADEINRNEAKLNGEKAKGEKKLTDAKIELDANAAKLNNARAQLVQSEAKLRKNIDIQNAKFKDAQSQIANGRNQIDAELQKNGIAKEELGSKINELNSAIQYMKKQQSSLPADSQEYAKLSAQIDQYSASYEGLLKLQSSIDTLDTREKQLNQGIAEFNLQIADAKNKIFKGKNELEINDKKLNGGYNEYNKNLATFNAKMTDAKVKIQDAREKLSTIEKPSWIILDRDTAVAGYSDLKSGTNTVTSVARIIPLFFILIVILMTSNTMARMIEEERSELGTLTSLGFNDKGIISTYLLYVLSATVLGTITGFFAGCTIIPKIIYTCFQYILPPLIIRYNIAELLVILTAAVALMSFVTVLFCNRELKQKPAALMRPVPPKTGQSIMLEKVGFVWRRLSFTWKVTIRNIFRYKQRVLMTIIGIAGCTALILAGFGIKDSINGIAQKQYGEIFKYDDLIVLKNNVKNINGDLESLLEKEQIKDPALIKQTALTCESNIKSLDTYLVVPENEKTFYKYFNLKSTVNRTRTALDDNGVIISQKISDVYKVGKGGKINVKDADNNSYTFIVSDVAENYMQNYIYMSKNLYGKIFEKSASYNMIASDYNGNKKNVAKHLINSDLIASVNFKDDILQRAIQGNTGLNNVVVLLVCIASILAVIVLYNLTSINISERKREIATLKVLGFTDGETNEYIYREAFILTLISIGVGLILGIGLHHFVMGFIEGDTVVYFRNIKWLSFVWPSLITMAFSIIMQAVTYFKLKKIDMIESLKSVE
ncbi:MAG TPA: peptide ABC transporter permease, partial [Clostridiaceae bacterium]|nr:peptide ABC transporter permease [Clostridiaceae bacterium]